MLSLFLVDQNHQIIHLDQTIKRVESAVSSEYYISGIPMERLATPTSKCLAGVAECNGGQGLLSQDCPGF